MSWARRRTVRGGLADTCSIFTLKWRVFYTWSQVIRAVVALGRRARTLGPRGPGPIPVPAARPRTIRSTLWYELALHFTSHCTPSTPCLYALHSIRQTAIAARLSQDCAFLMSLPYTTSEHVSRVPLRTPLTMAILGKLHVDIPSIGDAVLETALALLDQLNTHDDSYIAVEPIASLTSATHQQLPGHHHQHIVTIL
jgi:hypothetical protein